MKTLVEMPATPLIARHLVAGRWVADGCESLVVLSPYTGASIGTACRFSQEVGAFLVDGAAAAATAWRAVPIKERSGVLLRFREILLREIERLAQSVAREAGKTVSEGRAEILKGIEVLEFAASLQNSDVGGVLEVSRGVTCEYKREPLGVVAGITPFNFPAMVPMWMIPIAIAVGNAFILKPSEKVPFTPCLLGELMLEAGVPPDDWAELLATAKPKP
jgi:malonate-semialdehyde dehydrogenase (acetylating)/methylmalonate-semialdehyde dehydrogenase